MKSEKAITLLLRSKEFYIPSEFRYLNNVNPDIYKILTEKHSYEVKSDVSEEVFQSFLDHWVMKKLPNINQDNLLEYTKLSDEFDLMTDLVQIYSENLSNMSALEKIIDEKDSQIKQHDQNHRQVIEEIFNIPELNQIKTADYFSIDNFKNCNLQHVKLNLQKNVFEGEFWYSLNKQNFTATLYESYSISEDILIPTSIIDESIEYLVTEITNNVFRRSKFINSIQFEKNCQLKIINDYSFIYSSLKSITIPRHVKKIGSSAFFHCLNLIEVNFSPCSELQIINDKAFGSCSFNNLDLSNCLQLKSIGDCAFSENLETISIPSNLIDFKDCFKNCSNLKTIKIDSNNKYCSFIDNKLFVTKSKENNENFDTLVFASIDIEEVVIPSFIKKISPSAFKNCNKLNKIIFNDDSQLEIIDDCALNKTLEAISIPSNFVDFQDCFKKCSNLKTIKIDSNNKYCSFIDNKLFVTKSKENNENFDTLVFASIDIEEVVIPSYIKTISPHAFKNCKKLNKIIFNDDSQLEIIGRKAFCKSSIKSIIIPPNVKQIYEKAFYKSELTSIFISQKVTQIGKETFSECSKLKSVTFSNNIRLKEFDDELFYSTSIESISIPSSIQRIGISCFQECKSLKKVDFSYDSQLKIIDIGSFKNTKLESIKIPRHVKIIKSEAFYWCLNLKELTFDECSELKKIYNMAFAKCNIKKVIIPPHLSILYGCFESTLEEVVFSDNSELQEMYESFQCIEKLVIPPHVKKINLLFSSIKEFSFENYTELEVFTCTDSSLEKITVPKSVKELSFSACSNLSEVIFPKDSQLEIICRKAFERTGIVNITLPASVVRICGNAFEYCDKLKSVKFDSNSHLKIIEKEAFLSSSIENIEIPSSVCIIENEWAKNCYLKNISVSSDNKYYQIFDNKFLLKKSDVSSNVFDVLFYAFGSAKNIKIPSFIRIIDACAFTDLFDLVSVQFEENSQLEEISDNAFKETYINNIIIPSSVKRIGDNAFAFCQELSYVVFEKNSQLTTIGESAFYSNKIESIVIPQHVTEIGNNSFCGILGQIIEISEDSDLNEINLNDFCCIILYIPAKMKNIRIIE